MRDSRPRDRGFVPLRRHCVVSLSMNNNPSLVLVQPRKTRPYITERLLMGRKESNQTKTKQTERTQSSIGRHREKISNSAVLFFSLQFICTKGTITKSCLSHLFILAKTYILLLFIKIKNDMTIYFILSSEINAYQNK